MASPTIERRVSRWQEQRWMLDAIIKIVGPEWDQGRIASKSKPGGEVAEKDFRAAARRMKSFDDMHREFASAARKREARARAFEQEGRLVTAGESYMAAALLWASACWPIFEASETLHAYEERMNACYAKFIKYAPHPIEHVEVPFGRKSLPAYLHLPRKPAAGEKFPCIISIGGMDGSKENMVAMYGDRFLARGMAVLAVDGPGQAEAASRGIFFTPTNFGDAGLAIHKFLSTKKSIDVKKLGIRSSSFGSYFGSVASAALGDKIKGYAVSGVCHEPGCHTIFNMASPTFKARFMFMSGFEDEAAFDRFCKKIDLRPFAPKIKAPYMVVVGENDQLSPIVHTEQLFERMTAPRRLVIYEGANHSVANAPSVDNGDDKNSLIADWLLDRINGKPFASERVWVASSGQQTVTPYSTKPGAAKKARKA
ncbi:MAG TPA: alpha/beta hydrolase [Alphaproteobacteria bacterium]|jgi:fermentation-respiration switch protein FrsA (DUF1100 family)